MRILVDTQVWLWMLAAPERLRSEVRDLLGQARLEGVPILTADRAFERYDVEVIEA